MVTLPVSQALTSSMKIDHDELLGGRYRLISRIGEGGTSEVYEAEHHLTKERVALKLIPIRKMGDTKTVARFLREAKLTQGLKHPGFVQVYDAWIEREQRCCLVMERLYGESLRALSRDGQLTRREALEVISQLLEPVAIAHERGVVHRDLKPENVFVHHPPTPAPDAQGALGVVKLLDFGLSRSALEPTVTHTGQFVGTPWYISPEQAFSPKECAASSDVWSIGVMLYELMTDEVPFKGDSLPMLCVSIKQDKHKPAIELNPSLSPKLSALIDQCLSKEPHRRPQNARELASLLLPLKDSAFINDESAEVSAEGAVRHTSATLSPESLSRANVALTPTSNPALFDSTLDHDLLTTDPTTLESQAEELEEDHTQSEPAHDALAPDELEDEGGMTVPISAREVRQHLAALDEAWSKSLAPSQVELELGPTAIGTLSAIDWPEPDEPSKTGALETGALETDALETDALETGALETGALETGALETIASDTLISPPQSLLGGEPLLGGERLTPLSTLALLKEPTPQIALTLTSAEAPVETVHATLHGAPTPQPLLTAPLMSPPEEPINNPTQEPVEEPVEESKSAPIAASPPSLEAQELAQAVTYRKGISPFANAQLPFELEQPYDEPSVESSAIEELSFADWIEPSEVASPPPLTPPLTGVSATAPLESRSEYVVTLPKRSEASTSPQTAPQTAPQAQGSLTLAISLTLFLSALLLAAWRFGVLSALLDRAR